MSMRAMRGGGTETGGLHKRAFRSASLSSPTTHTEPPLTK